jgi:transcriptional regulator with XRE-family HTH domain
MENNDKSITPFHNRLKELLGKDVSGWAKKLGVNESTIRDRWFKGSYPGADKIIRIVEETGIPCDRLLFGTSQANNNVIVISREKYPEFYRILDSVLLSDKGDEAVSAVGSYLRGMIMTLDQELKTQRELDEIREKLDILLESFTRPTEKGKKK